MDGVVELLALDPELGLSPWDVWRMPAGLVVQCIAIAEQRARLRARSKTR